MDKSSNDTTQYTVEDLFDQDEILLMNTVLRGDVSSMSLEELRMRLEDAYHEVSDSLDVSVREGSYTKQLGEYYKNITSVHDMFMERYELGPQYDSEENADQEEGSTTEAPNS